MKLSSVALRRFHGWSVVFWLVMSVAAEFTGWVDSAKYISRLSEVALALSSAAAWQSSRTEVKQDDA